MPPMPHPTRATEPPAPRPVVRYRFRWEIFLVPWAVLLGLVVLEHVGDLAFAWDDVLDLGVVNRERFTAAAVLAVLLIAGLLVIKSIQGAQPSG